MTWAQVQASAAQATASGTTATITITGTLPVASGGTIAAPRLVLAYLINSGTGTWSVPTGWNRIPPAQNANTGATILWYADTGTHVGTSTTFTFNYTGASSANLKCWMEECSTTVTSATITLNASGTGVAGAVAQCTASTGGSAATTDLGVCCFQEHFTTGTAITWTTPAGWALVGSDQAGASANHQFAAHLLSAGAGVLTVSGVSSVASTVTSGWAGVLGTFTASPPPAGIPGYVGTFQSLNCWPSGTSPQQALLDFENVVSRTMPAVRIYYGVSGFPTAITSDMKAYADAGRKVCLSVRPAWNPPTTADYDQLNTFLASCKAYGLAMDVSLWHEPYWASQSSGAAPGMTPTQFITMFQFYASAIRANSYPAVFCTAAGSVWSFSENTWWPGTDSSGKPYADRVATDYYWGAYNLGSRFDDPSIGTKDPAYWADQYNLPMGIWEFATDSTITSTQATAYFTYIKTAFAARLTAGRDNCDILEFNSATGANSSPIVSASDFRVPLYQAIYDGLNAVTGTTALSVTTATVPDGVQGTAYSTTLAATGGTLPYTWSVSAGALPGGLSLASTGVLSGTPAASGAFAFTAQVADSAAHTDTQALVLTIAASATPLAVTTTSLPDATQNVFYTATLSAAGGS